MNVPQTQNGGPEAAAAYLPKNQADQALIFST